jgi:hypothetical protein
MDAMQSRRIGNVVDLTKKAGARPAFRRDSLGRKTR